MSLDDEDRKKVRRPACGPATALSLHKVRGKERATEATFQWLRKEKALLDADCRVAGGAAAATIAFARCSWSRVMMGANSLRRSMLVASPAAIAREYQE
jgi:hypothetical protein